jgi:DNA-binding CsgD family transcriptional regulator
MLSESDKDVLARLAAGLSPAQAGGADVLAGWRLIVLVRRHMDRYGREMVGRSVVEVVDRWYVALRSLSLRELQVAMWVAAGLSNREIGRELVISVQTVQRHMLSILAKAALSNRTELAVCALLWGWVDGAWCSAQIEARRRQPVSGADGAGFLW